MKSFCVSLVGLGMAFGLATTASAPPVCPYIIEVNALRGGSPTIKNDVKNITAKARILRGSAPRGTTQPGTSVLIEAISSAGAVIGSAGASGINLVVGKGGQGVKLPVSTDCTSAGSGTQVEYQATFTGTATSNGATCIGVRVLFKTCQ